jgi:hypothetical protein
LPETSLRTVATTDFTSQPASSSAWLFQQHSSF